MPQISTQVRLRPVRFAYLVRPDDNKGVTEIFRANTCLWGGKFNPIIPFLKQVPKWWDRHRFGFESATEILNGYLDFFEPDFIVEATPGLAEGLGFNSERIFQLSELLYREGGQSWSGQGLNVIDLYRDQYRKEYQFARRHEHNIVDVMPKSRAFKGFSACLFGAFPDEPSLRYLANGFTDAFDPKQVSLDGKSLADLYSSGFESALRIGSTGVDAQFHNDFGPTIFALNAHEPRDLIDFWNLRAIRRRVVPVPVQWLDELTVFSRKFIQDNHRPLPGNPNGVMMNATVLFARSIPTSEIEQLHSDHFSVDIPGANVRQDWYPAFWRSRSDLVSSDMRPVLTAAKKTFDLSTKDESPVVRFDCLHPEFAAEYGNENRWINVVEIQDWSSENQFATVYPCNYRNPSYPNFRLGLEMFLPTTEGLVIVPFHRMQERWELPDGATAIQKWLETHGIKVTMSAAGRSTQQIIQTMGGFWGVSSLANGGIIKLLEEISRKPTTRSIQFKAFKQRIHDALKGDLRERNSFERIVEGNAVELGLELRCTKCEHWSWYALSQLDKAMTCSLCLRQFGFPVHNPSSGNHSRWSYRLIGPFALPEFAKGGYAASLSIRFIAGVIGRYGRSSVTWSAGLELELTPSKAIESDFILWYQRERIRGNSYPTEVVFGEAKSFGREVFQDDDIERMKALATRFPGSVFIFSTMKHGSELSKDEIRRITKLAMWGREYIRERKQTRAPVIVLTGTELFTPFSLKDTWQGLGGKHAELIEPAWVRLDNLRVLADFTQQLYLNMPPYGAWLEAKWKKRAARRNAMMQ